MAIPAEPVEYNAPTIKATWTATYKGTVTAFRLVMNDSANGGSYTIETKGTDAVGKNTWTQFLLAQLTTDDRTAVKFTAKVLAGMLDAIYQP